MFVVGRGALVISLVVVLGCAVPAMSPIQRIRETLAMAENYQKIDQNVLDWYEAHPGEVATLEVFVHVEYEREPETSPHSDEKRTLWRRNNAILDDARVRREQTTAEAREELRQIQEQIRGLEELISEDIKEIRERNHGRRGVARLFGRPLWSSFDRSKRSSSMTEGLTTSSLRRRPRSPGSPRFRR